MLFDIDKYIEDRMEEKMDYHQGFQKEFDDNEEFVCGMAQRIREDEMINELENGYDYL